MTTKRTAAYQKVLRNDCQEVWVHPTKPHWIVYYEAHVTPEMTRHAYYEAYRAIEPVRVDGKPWTADNKRMSSGHGFSTLEEAMEAAS